MSDIKCVVCGEPWDSYGVNHGDMLKWESRLFKLGAGCPTCEGTPNGYSPQTLSDVENGDEDPMDRINAAERVAEGTAPKWVRPQDPVLWACDDCGVRAIRDLDTNDLVYSAPFKSRASYEYWHRDQEATEEPEHTFDSGATVCEKCYCTCAHCNTPIEPGDDNGSYPDPRNDTYDNDRLCGEECHSVIESEEANRVWSTCYGSTERLEYIRDHESQFSCLYTLKHATTCERRIEAWRELLANVRGQYFSGYASELIA